MHGTPTRWQLGIHLLQLTDFDQPRAGVESLRAPHRDKNDTDWVLRRCPCINPPSRFRPKADFVTVGKIDFFDCVSLCCFGKIIKNFRQVNHSSGGKNET